MYEGPEVEPLKSLTDAGIAQVTPEGALVELNPVFSRILGCPAEAVVGKKLQEIEPCVPHGAAKILRAFANRTLTKPLELVQETGSASLLVVVRPHYDDENLRSVVITAVDVTAMHRAQRIAEDRARIAEFHLRHLENQVSRPMEAPCHTRARRPDSEGVSPPRSGERLRVLVADDNAINRRVAADLLTNMGHGVVVVEDGAQAVEALKEERFDLVLMDIQMPVKDGLAATKEIRSGRIGLSNPNIPIVAMTAHALEGDRESFIEAGMDDFLAKPMTSEELERVVGRAAGAFEREWLVARYDGDADMADEVLRAFVEDVCPVYLRKSQTAIETDRREELAAAAHALWGACATVGAFRLQGICRKLYENAANHPADELRARWEDAYRNFLELKAV